MKELFCCEGILNTTYLVADLSHYIINGVGRRHSESTRLMFSRYVIDATTNGVHAGIWTAAPFQELFDRYVSDWRQDHPLNAYEGLLGTSVRWEPFLINRRTNI